MDLERLEILKDLRKLEEFGVFIPIKVTDDISLEQLKSIRNILTKQYVEDLAYMNLKKAALVFFKLSFRTMRSEISPNLLQRMTDDPDFAFLF